MAAVGPFNVGYPPQPSALFIDRPKRTPIQPSSPPSPRLQAISARRQEAMATSRAPGMDAPEAATSQVAAADAHSPSSSPNNEATDGTEAVLGFLASSSTTPGTAPDAADQSEATAPPDDAGADSPSSFPIAETPGGLAGFIGSSRTTPTVLDFSASASTASTTTTSLAEIGLELLRRRRRRFQDSPPTERVAGYPAVHQHH